MRGDVHVSLPVYSLVLLLRGADRDSRRRMRLATDACGTRRSSTRHLYSSIAPLMHQGSFVSRLPRCVHRRNPPCSASFRDERTGVYLADFVYPRFRLVAALSSLRLHELRLVSSCYAPLGDARPLVLRSSTPRNGGMHHSTTRSRGQFQPRPRRTSAAAGTACLASPRDPSSQTMDLRAVHRNRLRSSISRSPRDDCDSPRCALLSLRLPYPRPLRFGLVLTDLGRQPTWIPCLYPQVP